MNRVILAYFHKRLVGPATTPVRHLTICKDFRLGGVLRSFHRRPVALKGDLPSHNFREAIFGTAQRENMRLWVQARGHGHPSEYLKRSSSLVRQCDQNTNTGFRPVCFTIIWDEGLTYTSPPNDKFMDDSLLASSAPNRCTGEDRDTSERSGQNGSLVPGKRHSSQGPRYDDSNTAIYPVEEERRNGRASPSNPSLVIPSAPPLHQRRTTPGASIHDTCSDSCCSNTDKTHSPNSVDRTFLLPDLTKQEPLVNGSVPDQSPEMTPSDRLENEHADIAEKALEPAISTPQATLTGASNRRSRESSEDTTSGVMTSKPLSKADQILLYSLQPRIRRLREVTWGLRSRLQEQRGILRAKQYAKAAADDRYMQLVRLKESKTELDSGALSKEGRTLQELFQDLERLRGEYGPLEDDCNALEDELGSEEYALTRLEESFMRICNQVFPFQSRSPTPEPVLEGISEGSYSDVDQKFHPLVEEYLSKLGDIDIFRERHERHLEEKETLEEDRETRQRVNRTLTAEDEAWLQQSDDLENEILRDLQQARAEAEELRKKCQALGLLNESGNPKDFQTQEQEAFAEDVDAKGQISEYVKFPTLLPQPGTRDLKFKTSAPKEDEQSESAGDHINQWLLHSLRLSPLDVNLLASTFEIQFGDLEAHKWQKDVRRYWYRDGSIKDASDYRVYSVTDTTPVTTRSKPTKRSVPEHHYEPVLGITGRKRPVSDTSSVSGSESFGLHRENEMIVESLPRSKYAGTGS